MSKVDVYLFGCYSLLHKNDHKYLKENTNKITTDRP